MSCPPPLGGSLQHKMEKTNKLKLQTRPTLVVGVAVAAVGLHTLYKDTGVLGSTGEYTTAYAAHKAVQMKLELQWGNGHDSACAKWFLAAGTQLTYVTCLHGSDWLWAITGTTMSPGVGPPPPVILPCI